MGHSENICLANHVPNIMKKGKLMGKFAQKIEKLIADTENWDDLADCLQGINQRQINQLIPYIPRLLKHKEMVIRCDCLNIIADYKLERFYDAIYAAFNDIDTIVRVHAVSNLLVINSEPVDILKKQLEKEDYCSDRRNYVNICAELYLLTKEKQYIRKIKKEIKYEFNSDLYYIVLHSFEYEEGIANDSAITGVFKLIKENSNPEDGCHKDAVRLFDEIDQMK